METQIAKAHVILITEWDFERKTEIIVTDTQVFIYVNRELVAVKSTVEFSQMLSDWANS